MAQYTRPTELPDACPSHSPPQDLGKSEREYETARPAPGPDNTKIKTSDRTTHT